MSSERKADILLVDDESQIRRVLRYTLEAAGYTVREAEAGRVALGEVALLMPDLIVLDLGLPDVPGLQVLRALRQLSVPVLILSVLGEEATKIEALDEGANDYLVKPFAGGELLARLRVLLRQVPAAEAVGRTYRFGSIQIELERSRVLRDGRPVKLTAIEYGLLRLLVMNRDKVLTHRYILRELWGPHAVNQTVYLRTYVMRLRKKLGEDLASGGHLQTESGVGYRFVSSLPLR